MKLISISLSPNVFPEDIKAAREMQKNPSAWFEGEYLAKLTSAFADYFGVAEDQVYLFNAGRSALLTILQALHIGEGDEVLLQAFTCNAVPNPVRWAGAKPVYVDVDEKTFIMDIKDLEKKITKKSKAIIVQHTFGFPADMDSITRIAKRNRLYVVEDCAHALGSLYEKQKVGTFGDAAFFSFGRDKVISSVYGGLALVKPNIKLSMEKKYNRLQYPQRRWIKQQLRHPIIVEKLLRWYNAPFVNYGIGKFLLQFSQMSRFLSKAVHFKEKQGEKPSYFPAKMPNALAYLALKQFERLKEFNAHRKKLAEFYYKELESLEIRNLKLEIPRSGCIFLRYPVRHPNVHEIIRKARAEGILLGDWYNAPIAPDDTNLEKIGYKKGSCPAAEKLARETFNLPTNPNLSLQDAKKVIEFLKKWIQQ